MYELLELFFAFHKPPVKNMIFISALVIILMILDVESVNQTEMCPNVRASLEKVRKKRHLTFPDGSNVILTISLVKAFMVHAPSGWNIALEIDVMFPLPNSNFTNLHFRRKLHRRQRKDIWERLQSALELHNMDGRSCVIKSICEAKTFLAPPGKSLVHDILRAVFTFPSTEDMNEEFKDSFSELRDPNICYRSNNCPFSILDFVMTLNKQ